MIRLLLPLLLLWSLSASAHQDRIEKPRSWVFYFENGEQLTIGNDQELLIKTTEQIVRGKALKKVQINFGTGESLHFAYENGQLIGITTQYENTVLKVPEEVIGKLTRVHFSSVSLLWDGRDKKAFTASYFYFSFDMGTEKHFGKFIEVGLVFEDQQFLKASTKTPISENSIQLGEL